MTETCEFCGGTGQISYFQGVSRFLLTTEDCPECAGIGVCVSDDNGAEERDEQDAEKRKCDEDSKDR